MTDNTLYLIITAMIDIPCGLLLASIFFQWRGRALRAEAALAKIEATIAACEAEVIS